MAAQYPVPFARFWIAPNKPNAGGKVFIYENGTTTEADTWSDSALTVLNTKPLVLDANGQFQVQVFANASDVFSIEVKDVNDVVTETTEDDIFFLSEFAITSALVVAALAANTGPLDLAGTQMDGTAFASFITDLILTAAGTIDASAGAITLGNVTGLTTFDAGLVSTGDATVNSGNVIIGTSGKGIDFSATADGSGTTTSEILDDYEEGTFTPVLTDQSNNATSTTAIGRYTKIGNRVEYNIRLVTNSLGSVSGNLFISGLPFTSGGTSGGLMSATAGRAAGFTITAGETVSGYIDPSVTRIDLTIWNSTAGTARLQSGEWTADGDLSIAGHYEAV